MEAYFTDIPNIGDLSLEHVFYEYEEPILFVCTDASGKRYLCSCCRLSANWIIRQTDEAALINMIDNRISLDAMFRFRDGKTLFLSWDGENMHYSSDIPENAYPKNGSFLKLSKDKTNQYRNDLEKQRQEGNILVSASKWYFDLSKRTVFPELLADAICFQYTGHVSYVAGLTRTGWPSEPLFFNDEDSVMKKTVVSIESTKMFGESTDVNCEDDWLTAA